VSWGRATKHAGGVLGTGPSKRAQTFSSSGGGSIAGGGIAGGGIAASNAHSGADDGFGLFAGGGIASSSGFAAGGAHGGQMMASLLVVPMVAQMMASVSLLVVATKTAGGVLGAILLHGGTKTAGGVLGAIISLVAVWHTKTAGGVLGCGACATKTAGVAVWHTVHGGCGACATKTAGGVLGTGAVHVAASASSIAVHVAAREGTGTGGARHLGTPHGGVLELLGTWEGTGTAWASLCDGAGARSVRLPLHADLFPPRMRGGGHTC